MNIPKHPTLIRRMRDARLKKLAHVGPLVAATVVQQHVRCGRPGCQCARGDKHAKTAITQTVQGKTRTVYVPVDLVEQVRTWVAEHKRVKQLLKEISDLTVALIRTHAEHRDRRQARG
jgi:hypothetical protein